MDTEQLQQLGLAGAYSASNLNNPVDRTPTRHRLLKQLFIDYEPIGALLNAQPRMVMRVPEGGFVNNRGLGEGKVWRSWKMPVAEQEYYVCSYDIKQKLYNNLSFVHIPEYYRAAEANDFFREFQSEIEEYVEKPWPNKYNGLPFARISFPSGNANTNNVYMQIPLSGIFSSSSGSRTSVVNFDPANLAGFLEQNFVTGSGTNLIAYNRRFTKSIKQKNYLVWEPSNTAELGSHYFTSGSGTTRFDGYHILYPQTLESTQFYRYNIPTKLTTNNNYDGHFSVNGLLIISTGNPVNGKQAICYVSPHIIEPKAVNTVENYYIKTQKSFTSGNITFLRDFYIKQKNVFQVNALTITSLGVPSGYGNGLYIKTYPYTANVVDLSTTLYTGGPFTYINKTFIGTTYAVWGDQHLQQTIPLKDTPFYKFYTGLFSFNKSIATGTWDGIIPSGTFVNVELISTTLEENAGLNDDLYLVYSGIGSRDIIDLRITSGISYENFKNLANANVNNDNIMYSAYDTGPTKYLSITKSINTAKLAMYDRFNKVIKETLTGLFIENSKYRRSKAFVENKKATKNISPARSLPQGYYLISGSL